MTLPMFTPNHGDGPCHCPGTRLIHPRGWLDTRIDAQPTTRGYALARIAAGGQAFVDNNGKWWRLDAQTINNPATNTMKHYVAHECHQQPPPQIQLKQPRKQYPERPPY